MQRAVSGRPLPPLCCACLGSVPLLLVAALHLLFPCSMRLELFCARLLVGAGRSAQWRNASRAGSAAGCCRAASALAPAASEGAALPRSSNSWVQFFITRAGRRALLVVIAAGRGGVGAARLDLDLGVHQRFRRIFDHRGDGPRGDLFGIVRQLLDGELCIWIGSVRKERPLGEGSGGLDWRCGGLATFRVTPSGCWASL